MIFMLSFLIYIALQIVEKSQFFFHWLLIIHKIKHSQSSSFIKFSVKQDQNMEHREKIVLTKSLLSLQTITASLAAKYDITIVTFAYKGGVHGITVIVVQNGIGDPISNPDYLHFILRWEKIRIPLFFPGRR